MVKSAIVAVLGMVLFLTVSCSMMGPIKTPLEMSNQERAALVLILYNNAYSNYNAQFAATPKPMDSATKQYFQAYKQVMENAWPAIAAYTAIVQVGQSPTNDQETELINIIYQLQAMLVAKTS